MDSQSCLSMPKSSTNHTQFQVVLQRPPTPPPPAGRSPQPSVPKFPPPPPPPILSPYTFQNSTPLQPVDPSLPPPPPPTTTTATTPTAEKMLISFSDNHDDIAIASIHTLQSAPSEDISSTQALHAQKEAEYNKKRFYVIQEIISTELTYIERMRVCLEHVVKPMRDMQLLDSADLVEQFESLERVYLLHNRYSIVGSESQNLKFIELFEGICSSIDVYASYLVHYEPAMARRAALLISNRRFADFVDKVQKDPQMQGHDIEALLILPVQRIPRYRLLLEQLLKYTPPSHVDFEVVNDALTKICQLAHYNNEAIRARENKNKLMSIMLSIQLSDRPNLLDDKDRRFIKECVLQKQCRKRYKFFQFWLLSESLIYGELTALGYYSINRILPLSECQVSELPKTDPDREQEFVVRSPQKSFKLRASSHSEKKDWFLALEAAISNIQKQSTALGKVDVAPIWDPDSKSPNCSLCNAQFTILFRRHHCRRCGKLVCTSCSAKRFHLPNVSESVVRVCDICFDYLSPGNEKTSQTSTQDPCDSSDDEDDSDMEMRNTVMEDALDDFNDFEIALQKQGFSLNEETLKTKKNVVAHTATSQVQSMVVRKSFFSNLASGLAVATSALRPVSLLGESLTGNTSTEMSQNRNDSEIRRPRRPRRPLALILTPIIEQAMSSEELTNHN